MSPRGRHAAGAACPGDEPWARTSDRAVWRAYERGLVLTVTRLAGGRWQATVEGPSVVERSPMPFRTRKRVMRRLKIGARVVICGTASIASWDPPPEGPRVERHLLVKRARMQGFFIFDHVQRYPEALQELEDWVRNGQIRCLGAREAGGAQLSLAIACRWRARMPA